METNAEWRQLGAVVGDVMERLQARRQEQKRFIAESHAEVVARTQTLGRLRGAAMTGQVVPRQMELPLFRNQEPCAHAGQATL